MMRKIRCTLEIEDEGIVTLRGRHGETLAKFRFPLDCFGTFTRIQEGYDCDNYWMAVKPADQTVFEDGLFDPRKQLEVRRIDFSIKSEK